MVDNYKTSRDYERLIEGLVNQEFSGVKGVDLIEISHDTHIRGSSGYVHQIDVAYRFRVWAVEFLVLVECKQYQKKVGVDDLLEFRSRIDDIGAHKGLFVSSSGFQEGAVQFAKSNRIALLTVHGAERRHVCYELEFPPPEERCAEQVLALTAAYKLSKEAASDQIRIDSSHKFVTLSHSGTRVDLKPGELHQGMLYLQRREFPNSSGVFFFEDIRFSNLRTDRLLKALLIDLILDSENRIGNQRVQ